MKKLLAVATLATLVGAPALAQPASDARARAHVYHGGQAPLVQMYGAEHYQSRPSNQDVNPDFQLGGNRS